MSEEFVYGKNSVEAVIREGERSINKVFILNSSKNDPKFSKIIRMANDDKIPLSIVPKEKFNNILQENVNHQGVIASVSPVNFIDIYDVIDILKNATHKPLIIVLDGVEDPQNVGSIIRSAEVLGADAVIIPKRRAASITGTVAKASSGAIEFIPIARVTNVTDTLNQLKEAGGWVVGAEYTEKSRMVYDVDFNMPCVLVVGSEGKGISPRVKKACDILVKIPQFGKINSLNVANALSILVYEVVRQRTVV